ncbi:MAG: AMP-binding protein [Acidobacteriota bacterium]|nr:AMP-binding protein [Acidobacteriota bacterium]
MTNPFSILTAARQAPEALAMVQGEESWTWQRLARAVADVIERLEEQGVAGTGQQPWVAFTGDASLEAVIATCALAEIGAVAVPLHPRWPAEVRSRVLTVVRPAAIFEAGWSEPGWSEAAGSKPSLDEELPLPYPEQDPERPLALIHTSGSSGQRKGVLLSRRAFLASAEASAANLGWREDDRWLLNLPTAHVGGLSVITRCLAARKTMVLEDPQDAGGFSPRAFTDTVEDSGVTLASLVPTMLRRLLDLDPPWRPPEHLRAILLGGAPAPPALLAAAAQRGIPVLPTYGLTEACSQVATRSPAGTGDPQAGAAPPLAGMPPLPGITVRIVDGEIQVRGATLFSDYFPEGSHPFPISADGWLATGDLGRLDDHGNLHPLGRRGDLIVSGGENVSPQAVEGVLEAHPSVRSACVVGLEDEEWGQVVAALLVSGPDGPPAGKQEQELDAYLRRELAAYERPRRILWVDALPLGSNGKVDREASAMLFQHPGR